uniref:Multidrug resistance-associated protein 1 n=1 Tax=Timema monikensis TaxID=170555 RepID=A0A7R9DXU1_9NEOP|nr:unnamed protein product [Timema monikensis]
MDSEWMDAFCGSKFWDANVTWNTDDPDLTPCVQRTLLIYLPCAFLWAFSPLEVFYILNNKNSDIPWNWLNCSKMNFYWHHIIIIIIIIITISSGRSNHTYMVPQPQKTALSSFLVALSVADLAYAVSRTTHSYEVYPVHYCTPIITAATMALVAVLQFYNKKRGLRTSGLLFMFWFCLALLGAVEFRYQIRAAQSDTPPDPYYFHISYILFYMVVLAQFILTFFIEAPPSKSLYSDVKVRPCLVLRYHDEYKATLLRYDNEYKASLLRYDDEYKATLLCYDEYKASLLHYDNEYKASLLHYDDEYKATLLRYDNEYKASLLRYDDEYKATLLCYDNEYKASLLHYDDEYKATLLHYDDEYKATLLRYDNEYKTSLLHYDDEYKATLLCYDNEYKASLLHYDDKYKATLLRYDNEYKASLLRYDDEYKATLLCYDNEYKASLLRYDDEYKASLFRYDNEYKASLLRYDDEYKASLFRYDDEYKATLLRYDDEYKATLLRYDNEYKASLLRYDYEYKASLLRYDDEYKASLFHYSNNWFDGFIWTGYRRPLEKTDLWGLNPEDLTQEVVPKFCKHWDRTVRNKERKSQNATFHKRSGSVNITKAGDSKKLPSVLPAICRAFGPTFLFGSMLKLLGDVLTFASPQLLGFLIAFVSSDDPMWKGYLYAGLILLVNCVQAFINAHFFNHMMITGTRVRSAIISVIYRKALTMSYGARKESTVGEVVNLMAVDANRAMEVSMQLNMFWSAPLQIALALYYLWQILGPSVLAGLGLMILLVPLNSFIANKVKSLQIQQMKSKDKRIKLINEVLNGIRVLKLYAWEPSYEKELRDIRKKEVNILKKAAYLNAATSFAWTCAPFLVSLVTFATFVLIDENNVLDAEIAFVSLSLFNIMRMPLNMIPMLIMTIIQALVSLERINKFLAGENLNPENVSHESSDKCPLLVQGGTFSWGVGEPPVVNNVNLRVDKGALIAVVGTVGSGKSSLMSAILGEMDKVSGHVNTQGEMDKVSGHVNTQGSIAFVPQQAWIQNASLKENIMFGKSSDELYYDKVIEACALKPDFKVLPGGDNTEIGEKGINLSGGQKQRVSLARAVYNDADIYLLLQGINLSGGQKQRVSLARAVYNDADIYLLLQGINLCGGQKQRVSLARAVYNDADIYLLLQGINLSGGQKQRVSLARDLARAVYNDADIYLLLQGINLSGGQKQRVSLARAVYNDADIYLLDDPLSAVDSHVGKHIFEKVIGPTGLLNNKTRVLVTHGITFLPEVDLIVVLTDGEVSEKGTYKELMQRKGAFADFLDQHLQEVVSNDATSEADLEEIKQQLESSLGPEEFQRKFNRAISRISDSRSENGSIGDTGSLPRRMSTLSTRSGGSLKRAASGSLRRLNTGSRGQLNNIREKDLDLPKFQDKKLIEAERAEVGNVKWVVYKHYMAAIGLFLTIGTLVINAILQGFQVGSNLWLTVWSENEYGTFNFTTNLTETNPVELYLGVYGMLGLGQVLCVCIGTLTVSVGTINAANTLHNTMLANILRLPQSLFDTTPTGRILTRFSSDVNVLDTHIPMILRMSIPNLYRRVYVATSRQVKRLESIARAPVYSHFGESITELIGSLITFFTSLFAVLGRETMNPGLVGLSVSYALQITMTLNMLVRVASDIETNIVAVERIKEYSEYEQVAIFVSCLKEVLAQSTLVLFGGLTKCELEEPLLEYFLVRPTDSCRGIACLKPLGRIQLQSHLTELSRYCLSVPQEAPWENPATQPSKDWPTEGRVQFTDYKLRYREGLDLVLKGLNFTINGGEKVGIVGRTGAGKSSLTLALFRIIEPAGGSIIIDGVDIIGLGLHVVRSRITIIPQDPVLFSGSLRQNLDPFNNLSDDAVWKAIDHAHLKSFVKSLPAGLNHQISEGGENLSVGQRQLICLARALLRKTKVLVLDEATAAVDLETDDLIQATIRKEFQECTVLTIAHRLNTILDSNRVLVLDQGQVVEFDTPQSLLQKKDSVFYGMAKDAGLV